MKRTIGIVLTALAFSGCGAPATGSRVDISYRYDARTELCFAGRYGGVASASYAMTTVPCSDAVKRLAIR